MDEHDQQVYACPCCGHHTLTARGPATRQTCPVCFWFDYGLCSTYDRWKLWKSQVAFEKLGASSHESSDRTRPPSPEEFRDPRHAIDHEPERLRIALFADAQQRVHDAFADVSPSGRTTLGEAYRGQADTSRYSWDWHDRDEHWWEIPDEALDASSRQADIFSHGNYVSCMYYIAAYLMKDLRTQNNMGLFGIVAPRWRGTNGETAPPESLLTSTQKSAVVAFLRYMAVFNPTSYTRDIATRAIPRFEDALCDQVLLRGTPGITLPFAGVGPAAARRVPVTLMHACPCCGYRTFAAPPPGTREHCPVCWWFDIALEATGDYWSLWRGQVSFERTGAYYPACRHRVRAPAPDEARDPAWRVDHEPERRRTALYDAAERSIRSAFATVTPEGRVTLGRAYQFECPGHAPMWQWDDLDQHWSEIPDQVLEMCARVSGIFSFGNFQSFRYYLPAYLMMGLRGVDDAGLFAVTRRKVFGRSDETAHPEDVLTPDQCAAVDAYLAYEAEFGTSTTRALARQHRIHYAAKAALTVVEPGPTI